MNGIFYVNTKTNIPGWVNDLHLEQPLGYAYETDTHFVHIYGKNKGLNIISVGLTAIQKKSGNLQDWVEKTFGATHIQTLKHSIGHSIDGIWRPSLYYNDDIARAIRVNQYELRSSEQALRIIIDKLDELFLYVEPSGSGLTSYGHKSRELLILACTEVENQWSSLLKKAKAVPQNKRIFNTNDYVKLLDVAGLKEYVISFKLYRDLGELRPFYRWSKMQPTKSLDWYDSYNKTKHDRDSSFSEANLRNVINAVVANLVMFCVRFGPFHLINANNALSSIVNQHFEIKLKDSDPKSYYIPKIELPENISSDLFIYDSYRSGHNLPWNIQPLEGMLT